MEGALKRYRIMANVVGVMLLLLCVGMVLKYLPPHNPVMVSIVGTAHGFLYMIYIVLGYDVWRRARWPLSKMFDIASAGFIPFRTFFVERKIVRQARETIADTAGEAVSA